MVIQQKGVTPTRGKFSLCKFSVHVTLVIRKAESIKLLAGGKSGEIKELKERKKG
jgi:hypothetical protein